MPDQMERIESTLSVILTEIQGLRVSVDSLDHRVGVLEHRVEELDHRVESLDHRVEALDNRVEALDHRVGSLESQVEKNDYKYEVFRDANESLVRLSTSLIAGATISIIAGVVLLLLRS